MAIMTLLRESVKIITFFTFSLKAEQSIIAIIMLMKTISINT